MEENANITEIILNTINELFSSLFSSINNNLYTILDDITFIDESIIDDSILENLVGSSNNGILLVANALLFGFILYYAIKLLLSHMAITQTERPIQFIFKLIFFAILMNSSFFICSQIISLTSTISLLIRNIGEEIFNKNICFSSLINLLNDTIHIDEPNINIFSFTGIIKSLSYFGLLNLVFSYSLRYIMIKVFCLISPFAFMSLILPSSAWFFKSWLKAFLSLLFLQIFISIILLVIFSINFDFSDIFYQLLYIGSIYSLTRANTYIKEIMGGISTEIQSGISSFKSILKG